MSDVWIQTTIGDISDFVSTRHLPSRLNPETPYVGLEHIEPRSPRIDDWGSVEGVASQVTPFEPEDVLFGRLRPYLHKVVSADFSGVCSPEVLVLRANHRCLPKFLYLICSAEATVRACVSMSAGTRMPRTSTTDLASIALQLPSLEEQKRIVNLVSAVDEYIAALQRHADAARTARNAVLHELLTSGGDDWGVVPLSELLERSIGGVWGGELDSDQVNVTVVRSTEFSKSGILNFETGVPRSIKASQLATRELREGDILLEKSGGGPDQPVGRVVIVEANIPKRFVCSNFIQLLSPKSDVVLPRLLFMVMWNWHRQNKTLEFQAQTTGIRNLRTADYLIEDINLPPLREQNRIVGIVSSMDDVIREIENAIVESKNLRSGLLSDLLSGEHEIPGTYDRLLGAA